jgi:hypothetical protein
LTNIIRSDLACWYAIPPAYRHVLNSISMTDCAFLAIDNGVVHASVLTSPLGLCCWDVVSW